MAINCCVAPRAMPGFTGVTSIDVSVTAITVRSVEPDMLSDDAVIVVVPPAKADANPLEPDVLLIVATAVLDEFHVTDVVMFRVELSE